MGPDERAHHLPIPASAREGEALQPEDTHLPSQTLSTSPAPSRAPALILLLSASPTSSSPLPFLLCTRSHFCFQAHMCPHLFKSGSGLLPSTLQAGSEMGPHCCLALVPLSSGPPCSRGHVLGARNREAVKAAMMSRFPATAKPSVTTVPVRPRGGSCVASQAWRDSISASTASSWKWVPSTAQTWKSWWLWPVGKVGRSGHIPIPRAAPTHSLTHGKSPHHLGLLLP